MRKTILLFVMCGLALAYAQLFSVRSVSLVSIYDRLYGYVKGFNSQEMEDYLGFEEEVKKNYRTEKIKLEDLGDLEQFLVECFGIDTPRK